MLFISTWPDAHSNLIASTKPKHTDNNRLWTSRELKTTVQPPPVLSRADRVAAAQLFPKEKVVPSHHFKDTTTTSTTPHNHDPLSHTNPTTHIQQQQQQPVDYEIDLEYLGVMIDAGRHYFPVPWIRNLIDVLANMKYNLIHFRLTDDQAFNVLLESSSAQQLAVPSPILNPQHRVYTPNELRSIVQYARTKGIHIMPEINVPGHAGGWAAGPEHLVPLCTKFVCDKGYGLPLNVTHHGLRELLTNILREIVDIFDTPPFLHLGGDEVNMAKPCLDEMGVAEFDYQAFEYMLGDILKDIKYDTSRVVRWEMTGQKQVQRVGDIEQFWCSYPYASHPPNGKFFLSNQLYFDTNGDQSSYDVYLRSHHSTYGLLHGVKPTALIAATFELSTEFWYDRNILGRLLAVSLGAAKQPQDWNVPSGTGPSVESAVFALYDKYCPILGFGQEICAHHGIPIISTAAYHQKWLGTWRVWKKAICDRLAVTGEALVFSEPEMFSAGISRSYESFWGDLDIVNESAENFEHVEVHVPSFIKENGGYSVPYVGVAVDLAAATSTNNASFDADMLQELIDGPMTDLGMNILQIQVVSDHGIVPLERFPDSPISRHRGASRSRLSAQGQDRHSILKTFLPVLLHARRKGIKLVMELPVWEGAGWNHMGLLVQCPELFCSEKGASPSVNIADSRFFPIWVAILNELKTTLSPDLIYLGPKRRNMMTACWREALDMKGQVVNETSLSTDLESLDRRFQHRLEAVLGLQGFQFTKDIKEGGQSILSENQVNIVGQTLSDEQIKGPIAVVRVVPGAPETAMQISALVSKVVSGLDFPAVCKSMDIKDACPESQVKTALQGKPSSACSLFTDRKVVSRPRGAVVRPFFDSEERSSMISVETII